MGCREQPLSVGPQFPDPVFRYSLRMYSTLDLDRAFRSGKPGNTQEVKWDTLLYRGSNKPLGASAAAVELVRKTVGAGLVKLVLVRSIHSEVSNEMAVLAIWRTSSGTDDIVRLEQYHRHQDSLRVFALGWVGNTIATQNVVIDRHKGSGFSTVTFLYETVQTQLNTSPLIQTRDFLATSDIVDVDVDIARYLPGTDQ
jgi:hypothetical protein